MIDIATIKLDRAGSKLGVSVQSDQLVRLDMAGVAVAVLAPVAAEIRDALSRAIVISGRTPAQIEADCIVMAMRHQLALLEELRKRSPAEVARIYEFLFAHVRSAHPTAGQVVL